MTNSITSPAHRALPIQNSNSLTIEALDLAITPQGQKAQNVLQLASKELFPAPNQTTLTVRPATTPTTSHSPATDPAIFSKALPGFSDVDADAAEDRDSRKNSGFLEGLKKVGWYLLTGEISSGDDSLRRELNSKIDELSQQVKTQQALIEQLSQWLAAQSSAMATAAATPPQPATGSAPATAAMPASPAGPSMDKFRQEEVKRCQQILNGHTAMRKMALSEEQYLTIQDDRFVTKGVAALQAAQKKNYEKLGEKDKKALHSAFADKGAEKYLSTHGPLIQNEHGLEGKDKTHVRASLHAGLNEILKSPAKPSEKAGSVNQATQTEQPGSTKVTTV